MSQKYYYTLYPIDSAITANELHLVKVDGEDAIQFGEQNLEYKFLTILPTREDGRLFPMVSKDLKCWRICFAAYRDEDGPIDLQKLMEEAKND